MLQLKGGFLRTGRRSGRRMVLVGTWWQLVPPKAAGYHQRSQPELKLLAPTASPPKIRSGMGGGEQYHLHQLFVAVPGLGIP